jgi:NADH-quinone oxidoreductase subunit C
MTASLERFHSLFEPELARLLALDIRVNRKGVISAWGLLATADMLLPTASAIKRAGGRLSTITAYQVRQDEPSGIREIAYHFDIDGATLTLTAHLDEDQPAIDSITPLFPCADWHEREFMELYAIAIKGHPNPRRLFIDENIDRAVLQHFIPLSDMVNAASTQSLWEKIMSARGESR